MIDGNRAAKPAIAGIGASSGEHQAVVDRLLGAGIVWAEQLGRMNERVDALYLFVPAGQALTIETRLTSIRQEKIKVFLYEVDQRSGSISLVEPFDQGDLAENFGKAARRAMWPDKNSLGPPVQALADSIVRIAPDFIEVHLRPGSVVLSIRGLPLARVVIGRRRACFGLDGREQDLTDGNRGDLERLVAEIISN